MLTPPNKPAPPTTVADLMTEPVVSIPMDTTMAQVRAIFDAHRFHHLVVCGPDGTAIGVISDRDLLATVSPFVGKMAERSADVASLERRAHQVMSRKLVSVRPSTLLRAAARVMLDQRISCLPVVDRQRRCVGIVTVRDVVRWSIDQLDGQGVERDSGRRAA